MFEACEMENLNVSAAVAELNRSELASSLLTAPAHAALLSAHGTSVACLAAFSLMFFKRVEFRHPVYALFLQDLLLLTILESGLSCLLGLAAWERSLALMWIRADYALFYAKLMVHEVTWTCAAALREGCLLLLFHSHCSPIPIISYFSSGIIISLASTIRVKRLSTPPG